MEIAIKAPSGHDLFLHDATLCHLAGVDPRLGWRARGISAHDANEDHRNALATERQKLDAIHRQGPGFFQGERLAFLNDALQMFEKINTGVFRAEEYFADQRFRFVLGAPRSGGTLLFTEICRANGIDYASHQIGMMHDSIPDGRHLVDSRRSNTARDNARFQFAQYLAWAKHAFAASKIIPQKRIMYAHWLDELDGILGDSVDYVVTVRHPFDSLISFFELSMLSLAPADRKRLALDDDPYWPLFSDAFQFDAAQDWKKIIAVFESGSREPSTRHGADLFSDYWRSYHLELLALLARGRRVELIPYGKGLDDYIGNLDVEHETRQKVRGRERDYAKLVERFGDRIQHFNEAVDVVVRAYGDHALTFPRPPSEAL